LSPTQLVSSLFTIPGSYSSSLGTETLADALAGGGGSTLDGAAKILLRAAVASVLNSLNPSIGSPLTRTQIVSQVNAALISNNRTVILALAGMLDSNNNLGCPISGK
jgi:hypothetical protein